MILVDRGNDIINIILTLDGRVFISSLSLKNDATRDNYALPLPDDTSPSPERYNLFSVPVQAFEDMPDGYYAYEVLEAVTGDLIESGKLYIKPSPAAEISAPDNIPNDVVILN